MKNPLMKDFLTKKQFRVFANDRLFNAKLKRIVSFSKTGIIFTAISNGEMCHGFSYGYIQGVVFDRKEATYVINYKEFETILNEVDFFRRFPEDAKKRKVTVI